MRLRWLTRLVRGRPASGVDLRVLAFSGGVSLLATLAFGLAPALMLSNPAAGGRLANRSSGDGGRSRHRLLSLLVVGEVALSAMLLVGAGLTTRSLWNVLQVDPGFDARGVMALDLSLPADTYPDVARRATFLSQLIHRLDAVPGVASAAAVNSLPLSQTNTSTSIVVDGQPPAAPGDTPRTDYRVVSQGYFATMGTSLLRGRSFDTGDLDTTAPVVVVNQAFVEQRLAGSEALTNLGLECSGVIAGVGDGVKDSEFVPIHPDNFLVRRLHSLKRLQSLPANSEHKEKWLRVHLKKLFA